jgi:hypothetical protein
MDNNSQVTGLRALVANVMLERARELSDLQACEVWRLIQLIDTGASPKSVRPATLQLAMDFNAFRMLGELSRKKLLAMSVLPVRSVTSIDCDRSFSINSFWPNRRSG